MAYYNGYKYGNQYDQDQDPNNPTGMPGNQPAQAPGPIPKTPGQGSEIPNSQPSNANVPANQSNGTRSKQNFVNIQRYLEANPMGAYAQNVNNLGNKLKGQAEEAYNSVSNSANAFFKTPEYNKWVDQYRGGGTPDSKDPNFQNYIWEMLNQATYGGKPKNGALMQPEQGAPTDIQSKIPLLGNKSTNNPLAGNVTAENALKELIKNNQELFPQNITWNMPTEIAEKSKAFSAPNKTGTMGLAGQMADKESQYTAGMNGLDTALFGTSPEVLNAAKAQGEGLTKYGTELDNNAKELNKRLETARGKEAALSSAASGFLGEKWEEGKKRLFPYQGKETEGQDISTDLPIYKKLAAILGKDPNLLQMQNYVPPAPQYQVGEVSKEEAAVGEGTEAEQNKKERMAAKAKRYQYQGNL